MDDKENFPNDPVEQAKEIIEAVAPRHPDLLGRRAYGLMLEPITYDDIIAARRQGDGIADL